MEDRCWSVLPMPVLESPLLVSPIAVLLESQKRESVFEKNVNCEREIVPIPNQPQL